MHEAKDPSNFVRRLQSVANSADMKNCPLAAQILLKYTVGLTKTQLDHNIKKFPLEELRKTPNTESINSVLQAIETLMSDENSSKYMNYGKKYSVFWTIED